MALLNDSKVSLIDSLMISLRLKEVSERNIEFIILIFQIVILANL
jgi:hypothetical protein